MSPPVVLHLSCDVALKHDSRFVHDFRRLADDGHLVHVPVAPQELAVRDGVEQAVRALVQLAHESRPDVILVETPHGMPIGRGEVRQIVDAAGRPPVVYWEGDAWGRRKRLLESIRAWLGVADQVFSIAMGHQYRLLRAHTRAPIRYVPHVLPHVVRTAATDRVPDIHETTEDVTVIGNHLCRLDVLGGLPGSLARRKLVRGLQRLDCRLAIYGSRWRGRGARGILPFAEQVPALQRSRISAAINHFPKHPGNFSDRLPISLYAGRVHVTGRVLGADWLPDPDHGLYLANTPAHAVTLVRELLREDPSVLHAAGLRGRLWVLDHLTDLHALQYMLGSYLPLPSPPADPWQAIADFTGLPAH